MEHCGFRRARRPEQVAARRATILDAAVAMLRERPVADISLRELSERVGLAKSNVLRYFDSREAIFLEVLDQVWTEWLDRLELRYAELPGPVPDDAAARTAVETGAAPSSAEVEAARLAAEVEAARLAAEVELARVTVSTLLADPLLCELLAAMGGVLERNISLEFARDFKARAFRSTDRAAALVLARLPHLGAAGAARFVAATGALLAGLWPHAHPTDEVAVVMAERGFPAPRELFADLFTELLADTLAGISRRALITRRE